MAVEDEKAVPVRHPPARNFGWRQKEITMNVHKSTMPDAHGDDSAATPTELFVASLASCVAFYAGRFLHRHDLPRDGLRVTAEFGMATDRPARVDTVRLRISAPGLPEERREALRAVASHCTVHNTLQRPPEVTIDLAQVCGRGYAIDDEELNLDVRRVAASIFDLHGVPLASIGISGPASRITLASIGDLGHMVWGAAFRITQQMGGRIPAKFDAHPPTSMEVHG